MLLFAEMNMMLVVSGACFVAFAAIAWIVMDMMSGKKSRAEERLTEFRDPSLRKSAKKETIGQKLEKVSPGLAKPMQPKTEKEVGKLKKRLSYAGFRSEAAPGVFLASKFIGLLVGVAFTGGTALLFAAFKLQFVLILAFFLFLPDVIIWFLGRRRKEAVFMGLPDCLDLMVVCVEAGLGLDQAMRKVADEMKKSHRVIAEEFSISNFQIQYGKTRRDVLQELGTRTGVDDLRSLAAVLIQAEKFGASVGQALRVQSDSMRTRRRQLAEERAAKTAVQLIFPLVLFIFPGIFVVLVGPAAITMMNEMFPAMGG